MTWVGLPVDILERLERLGASRDDRLLYVEGFVYAGQYMTNGTVTSRLPRLSDHPDPDTAAGRLVDLGVWEGHDDVYFITDYLSANLSSDEINRRKEDQRIRQERSRRHKAGDHSKCIRGRYCPDGAIDPVTRDRTRDNTRESQHTYLPDLPDLPEHQAKVGKGKSVDDGRGSPDGSPTAPSTTDVLHVFTDPQRLGHCCHCNLPARNAAHHNGVPAVIKRLAETVADIGPLIPERSSDSTEQWWQAVIRDGRVEWTFETGSAGIDDDDFSTVPYIAASVDAALTNAEFTAWEQSVQADDQVTSDRLAWYWEGNTDTDTIELSLSAANAGNYSANIDVTHHLHRLRHHVTALLAYPKAATNTGSAA